jgi:hypothetical protein
MAVSNTSILIKRSSTTTNPGTLKAGEIAYSYASNTLYFGTVAGNGTMNIGGQYYTSTVDAATNANTVSTLVKRDANGAFSGNLQGNSTSAFSLTNPQNFSISGGDISATAVSFNGTSSVALNASLSAVTGLTAGSYGSSSIVPVLGISANGRITSISTVSVGVSSSFNISNTTTSNTIYGGATFYQYGDGGITTAISANTVTIGTDNTIARTNTSSVGIQTFSTDITLPTSSMTIGGTLNVANLYVSGNLIQTNATQTLNVADPIIYLASNNNGNLVDIGVVGHFVGTGHTGGISIYQHTGFVRDYNDNKWKLFSNVVTEPTSTVVFDANTWYDTIKVGGLVASNGNVSFVNVMSANTLTLLNALGVSSGGTGAATFSACGLLIGNGTSALSTLANTTLTATGTGAQNNTVSSITVDSYGRTTALTYAQITGLTVGQGGTGGSTFTANGIIYGNGTSAMGVTAAAGTSDQLYSNQILTVTNGGVPIWSSSLDGGTF